LVITRAGAILAKKHPAGAVSVIVIYLIFAFLLFVFKLKSIFLRQNFYNEFYR